MSNTKLNNEHNGVKHSEPIPIASSPFRRRSASVSSASSGSASSGSELPTPISPSGSRVSIPSPGSSPLLSYFLSQSPTVKAPPMNGTFPFSKRFSANPPVFEEDEQSPVSATAHARRASATVAGRFTQPAATLPLADPRQERGTGVLRRLSLSSAAFTRPSADLQSPPLSAGPPNTAVSQPLKTLPFSGSTKPRRSATLGIPQPRRAPSPMGERILKGHFDGFN